MIRVFLRVSAVGQQHHSIVIAAYDAKSAAGVLAQHSLQRILPKCNAPPPGAADPG